MLRRQWLAFTTSFVLTLFTLPNEAEALLASVKTTGMAATATAYPQDALAGAYNPAGISRVHDRIDIGGVWDQTRQRGIIEGNIASAFLPGNPTINGSFDGAKTQDFYTGEFGFKQDFNCHLSTGLIVYNRNFLKTTYGVNFPLLGDTPMGLEYLHETISGILAYKMSECQSVGISFNFNLQRLKVNGVENLGENAFGFFFSSDPQFVSNKGYSWSSGIGVSFGYYGKFFDKLAVGLAYQPYTHMSKFDRYKGFLADHGKFNLPQRWNLGVAYDLSDCSTIAYDFEYVNWEQVKALTNNAFPNILIAESLGTASGAGFGFRDQYFHRIGIDYQINPCWQVRMGFRHVNVPFGSENTTPNLLTCDTVQNFLTVGATYYQGCNEASILYAHGFQKGVKGKNSIADGFPPNGSGGGFGGGEANLRQRKNALGLALARKF